MILIAGLGNPGKKYKNTRHNVGFMVVDELAKRYRLQFRKEDDYLIAVGGIENRIITLIKPSTYMNLSGKALKKLADEKILKNLPDSLIVIHDDLDLPVGKIKIKRNGSSGGHRGIQSIIEYLGTKDFIRIKVGIGKPERGDVSDYVLSKFSEEQKELIKQKILKASDAVITILKEGITKAMNIYNRGDC
ncbi:MAG: aminoacyl-tRNA hydrolase [Thermodesulfovibrio sp.]|nr:aminoacyl-tRNA hydrolase [Thermodesulfovibrio sp.]